MKSFFGWNPRIRSKNMPPHVDSHDIFLNILMVKRKLYKCIDSKLWDFFHIWRMVAVSKHGFYFYSYPLFGVSQFHDPI